MRLFFNCISDATIYEEYPNRQSGIDEILSVGKNSEGNYRMRSLLQFDIASLSSSIVSGTIPTSSSFSIKLYTATASKLLKYQGLEMLPVSSSWVEGQGYFYQDSYSELGGVTWGRRDSGVLWSASGSDYITSVSSSCSSSLPVGDYEFEATSIVQEWLSGSFEDNGVLIKFPTNDESSSVNVGSISLFSKDTHTVFYPVLIAKWDDSIYITGSLTGANQENLVVYPSNLRPSYKENEEVRVDLVARCEYPLKTFSTQFSEWGNHYLPSTTYYSIEDVQSREQIVPFDDFSKVSCDVSGSYFNFKIQKMHIGRHYKLKIKTIINSYQYIFDSYTFTIVA